MRRVALALLYLCASAALYGLHPDPALVNPRFGVLHMVEGDAQRPFVRRALVPALVRVTHSLLPRSVVAWVDRRAAAAAERRHGAHATGEHRLAAAMSGYWSVVAVSAVFMVLSLAGALFVLRRLLQVLFAPPPLAADLFPLVLIAMLPAFMSYSVFIYDYAVILLFAAAILSVVQERWRAYYVIYTLALLNKETAVLLPVVFLATQYDAMARPRLARHLVVQLALAVVVLGWLWWMFRGNDGESIELHLRRNLAFLGHAHNYFRFEKLGPSPLAPAGLPLRVPLGLNLPFILVVSGLIAAAWHRAPAVLRRSLAAMFVPIVVMQLCFGLVDEVRVWYEAMPVVVALLYVSASTRLGRSPAPAGYAQPRMRDGGSV